MIERHRTADDPTATFQLEQLQKLRILETSAAGDATWQLSFPVQQLLGFLLRHQTLTGAAVINAYVVEMGQLADDLERGTAEADADAVTRALGDLQGPIERLRNDSASNRDRLTTEALEVKGDPDRLSARARFERINHLWHRYLIPLREILDPDASMDATLDRLGAALVAARIRFSARASLEQGLRRAGRVLNRLRRSVFSDHDESVREVEPLYRRLRRDTRLSRGASRALELLRSDGWGTLPVEQWLALPRRERSPRLSDAAIEAYLHGIRGYRPARPAPVPVAAHDDVPPRLERDELVARLRQDAPITDVLDWLTRHFDDRGGALVLRAYGWIYQGDVGPVAHSPAEARDYALPELVLRARPLELREVRS